MKNICKIAAGLALSGLFLTAHAQTTPMPQDRPSTDGKMMDGKMKDGKMKGKDGKMKDGKMKGKDKMADDKMKTKM